MISFTGAFRIILFLLKMFSILFLLAASFESALFKVFQKKKWKEILKYCTKINLIMASTEILLGISFFFLNFSMIRLFPTTFGNTIFLFFWLALPAIIIWIKKLLYKHYWDDLSVKKLMMMLIISNMTVYILLSLWLISKLHTGGRADESARRISCTSNLKQIGLSLLQYAWDYNNYLPNKPGAEGFEQLRFTNYLTDPQCFACPSKPNERAEDGQKLSEKTVGYVYKNGYKSTNPDKAKIPVVWDKADNHKDYGSVLFLDGHVQGFKGANWMEQAGIKERNTKLQNFIPERDI